MSRTPSSGDRGGAVFVMVGTTKGAFLLRSGGARRDWRVSGPFLRGEQVYALALDQRNGRRRLLAGGSSDHWGPSLRWSDDLGETWSAPERALVRFPEDAGAAVARVWQIVPAPAPDDDTLYCGVDPAALFVSRDAGGTWSLVRGLWDHPHRPRWQPGAGGLCLHTILPDPSDARRMVVAISAAGVYRTEDGGATWSASNRGVRAQFLPDPHPEFGQCVHKVVAHPAHPRRLFLQNHWGLYRSDDGGGQWHDIARDVPSDFGFAMGMHPHDPETVYIVPIESDMFRCTPEGRLRVYRTRDGGASWEPLTRGLPQEGAFETVLRDGLALDPLNPAGVYFGTRSGSVWASPDGGASWSRAVTGLPPVVCVKATVIGDPGRVRIPGPARRAAAARAVRRSATAPPRRAAAKKAVAKRARRTTPKRAATKRARPVVRRGRRTRG